MGASWVPPSVTSSTSHNVCFGFTFTDFQTSCQKVPTSEIQRLVYFQRQKSIITFHFFHLMASI